jgi:hypothetical protein
MTAKTRHSRYAEMFFRTDGTDSPADEPVVVFHHLWKTAGTSLREIVRANLPPAEREARLVEAHGAHVAASLKDWYRAWLSELVPQRRARLCCLMSHSANCAVALLDRPVMGLLLVREPVDRVMSQFHVQQKRQGLERPEETPEERHRDLRALYAENSGNPGPAGLPRIARYFNGQARSLLAAEYDIAELGYTSQPPPDADRWRERVATVIDTWYTPGTQERFDDYLRLLARELGWRAEEVRRKVNRMRPPRQELPEDLAETILEHSWLDVELHRLCEERLDAALGAGVPHG